jgi:predicted dehydrogenase
MPNFHFAILGLGKIARKFAQDIALIEGAKLVAVGSRSRERAKAFAADFGAEYAAGSYEATFDGPRVDAVYVATPHISHRALTIMCLERGIPVICEKPLGLNLREVEEMVAVARERKVYLMEALWTRFLPSTQKIKALIDSGAIGSLESVRADFGFLAPAASAGDFDRNRILNPALGGGALLDIGIYPQFLAQFLLGAPQSVHAHARLTDHGVDVDTTVTGVHAGGKLSHSYSTLLGATRTEALILGSEASIHWHSRWHQSPGFSILRDWNAPPENMYFDFGEANGYRFEAEAVIADVMAGRTENAEWSLEDSLNLHRTLTEVRQQIGVRYPGE